MIKYYKNKIIYKRKLNLDSGTKTKHYFFTTELNKKVSF